MGDEADRINDDSPDPLQEVTGISTPSTAASAPEPGLVGLVGTFWSPKDKRRPKQKLVVVSVGADGVVHTVSRNLGRERHTSISPHRLFARYTRL